MTLKQILRRRLAYAVETDGNLRLAGALALALVSLPVGISGDAVGFHRLDQGINAADGLRVIRPLCGMKRTSANAARMSQNDPKRTFATYRC
jgi:hypothetical protein